MSCSCYRYWPVIVGEEKNPDGGKGGGTFRETKMDIPLVAHRSQENKVLKQVKKKVPILTWLPKYIWSSNRESS